MNEAEITDSEVIEVLIDGGRRLCDFAEEQWLSGKYGNDTDMIQNNLKRWRKIRSRIKEIGREIRAAHNKE